MPIIFPTTPGVAGAPINWTELYSGYDPATQIMPLFNALGLLLQTFPGRYEKYSILLLRNQMAKRSKITGAPPGLRVWNYTPNQANNNQMCAFFFMRNLGPKIPVYAMSVGLDPTFSANTNAQNIYSYLLPLCKFMASQALGTTATPTSGGLEILNELNMPAGGNTTLIAVFNYANAHATTPNAAIVGDSKPIPAQPPAWTSTMYRWAVDPNA